MEGAPEWELRTQGLAYSRTVGHCDSVFFFIKSVRSSLVAQQVKDTALSLLHRAQFLAQGLPLVSVINDLAWMTSKVPQLPKCHGRLCQLFGALLPVRSLNHCNFSNLSSFTIPLGNIHSPLGTVSPSVNPVKVKAHPLNKTMHVLFF